MNNAVIQQAIFRPRSGVIVALTILLAFVVGSYGWVVLGLGLIVWLISAWETMRNPQILALVDSLEQNQKTAEIIDGLTEWLAMVRPKLPSDVIQLVDSISQTLMQILPKVENINSSEHNIYMVRQIAESYLPETIDNYLKLPEGLAERKKLREGKTAHELLMGQLALLDGEMKELLEDFHSNDTQRLLAHGRFLQDKFGESDLLDLS